MNSSAQAMRHASRISSSVAFSSPQRRFSRMLPENRVFFCSTMAQASRRCRMVYRRTSCPPTLTLPSVTSYSRGIRLTRVVFALPVPPRMPTVAPEGMVKLMSSRFQVCPSALYRKYTWSKRIDPSATVSSFCAASSVICGSSLSTSLTRLPQAMERVSIIITMDTIIREMRISDT